MKNPNPEFMRALKQVVNTSPYPLHMHMFLVEIGYDNALIAMVLHR